MPTSPAEVTQKFLEAYRNGTLNKTSSEMLEAFEFHRLKVLPRADLMQIQLVAFETTFVDGLSAFDYSASEKLAHITTLATGLNEAFHDLGDRINTMKVQADDLRDAPETCDVADWYDQELAPFVGINECFENVMQAIFKVAANCLSEGLIDDKVTAIEHGCDLLSLDGDRKPDQELLGIVSCLIEEQDDDLAATASDSIYYIGTLIVEEAGKNRILQRDGISFMERGLRLSGRSSEENLRALYTHLSNLDDENSNSRVLERFIRNQISSLSGGPTMRQKTDAPLLPLESRSQCRTYGFHRAEMGG
jgi:hypothetical protein